MSVYRFCLTIEDHFKQGIQEGHQNKTDHDPKQTKMYSEAAGDKFQPKPYLLHLFYSSANNPKVWSTFVCLLASLEPLEGITTLSLPELQNIQTTVPNQA